MELFSVERDGFCGFLHEPASGADRFIGKAIVVLGGSEGNESIPRNLGARFSEEGLREHGHPWEVERLAYKHASHIMVPLETGTLKLFREEREHPRECAASRLDAFRRTLAFLERW